MKDKLMKKLICVAAACMIATMGFGQGGEDNSTNIFPMCPPNCAKKPPVKAKVKKVEKSKLKG